MYFIATITDLSGIDQRVPGYFITQQAAIDVVEKNRCDIHENCYKYAVIEELSSGLYPDDLSEPLFYEWKDGKYQRIDRPTEWESVCNFTIG